METLSAFSLPPGFGFHPTDVELVSHYLRRKIHGMKIDFEVIPEVDIYKHEPWDLPARCNVPTRDSKWHFFTSRDKKYPNGSRSNRATEAGYWKSTGKDRNIRANNRVIGTKKTLVFHEGRPPYGKRTEWIMHEYYISESECKTSPEVKASYVLCRVTKRNNMSSEGENISAQTDEVDNYAPQPKITAELVAPKESLSPSEDTEDIDKWVTELFDPNFPPMSTSLTEVKLETKALPQGEDLYSILQSEYQNLDFDNNYSFFQASNNFDTTYAPKDDAGIELRQRASGPTTMTTTMSTQHRIKLQVSKMERTNEKSLSKTVRVAHRGVHLDPYDENHHKVVKKSQTYGSSCFFLSAFSIAALALITYFVLY